MTGPYKFDAERRALYLELLRKGHRLYAAAESIGMRYQSIWDYCKRHPEFKQQMDEAEAEACGEIEDVLLSKARSGDIKAIQMWLHNRASERWKDRRQPTVQITQQPAATDLGQIEAQLLEKLKEVPDAER